MLKRKNLVDEFSLIVRQEIKNYQDSSLAMNLAINSNSEQTENLSAQLSKKFALLESELKKQSIIISACKDDISKQDIKIERLESENASLKKNLLGTINGLFSSFAGFKEQFKELVDKSEYLYKLDCDKEHLIQELYKFVQQEVYKLENRIKSSVGNVKSEILNRPSEVEDLKKELLDKIEVCSIDKKGLDRELVVLKKSVYVLKKEIENAYNLIDRLKK